MNNQQPKTSNQKLLAIWFPIIFSAGLLILSFPKTDWFLLAWVGFVPLLALCEDCTFKQCFWNFYWTGLFFFLGVFYWIGFSGFMVGEAWLGVLTFAGAALLCAYFAFYFGLFGMIYFYRRKLWMPVLVLPAAWVILEYGRAHFLSGFGWASLGYSQYKNLPLIQIADLTGVYGISFAVFFVNLCVWQAACLRRKNIKSLGWLIIAAGLLSFMAVYGVRQIKKFDQLQSSEVKVAIVQGNVPQDEKWNPEKWPAILDKYLKLTQTAIAMKPDLVVWPETSFPGLLWQDKKYFESLMSFSSLHKTSLLVGSVVGENDKYFNSAFLLSSRGAIAGRYDKIHLVPFGEYVPLRKQIPALASLIPMTDFTSGRELIVFDLGEKQKSARFAVLICFEDAIPEIVSKFVERGAQFLVVITNDAWFADTKAPFMHWQVSVLRAVENRRSVLRAANTGVSGFISPSGKMTGMVKNFSGKATYIEGAAMQPVLLVTDMTFYVRHGDVFVWGCLLLCGLGITLNFLTMNYSTGRKEYA
ncbi:MAG: apolipoprotein N-acyltransferase [Candidatus Omnitrophica bacterium]|nr:apolipoprotein N-acyltransferase [Candidatus Omnitrophota bacterium]